MQWPRQRHEMSSSMRLLRKLSSIVDAEQAARARMLGRCREDAARAALRPGWSGCSSCSRTPPARSLPTRCHLHITACRSGSDPSSAPSIPSLPAWLTRAMAQGGGALWWVPTMLSTPPQSFAAAESSHTQRSQEQPQITLYDHGVQHQVTPTEPARVRRRGGAAELGAALGGAGGGGGGGAAAAFPLLLPSLPQQMQHDQQQQQQQDQQQQQQDQQQQLLTVGTRHWGNWWDGRGLLRVRIYDFAVYVDAAEVRVFITLCQAVL
jgi:hypothetical protein